MIEKEGKNTTAGVFWAEAVSYDFTKSENWRRREDSNLRYPFGHTAFRVRRIRPLCHASLNFRRSE